MTTVGYGDMYPQTLYGHIVATSENFVGLVLLAVMIFTTSEYSPFIYHGGLVLASMFSVMTIAALTHPASQLGRLLGSEPLRWIGVRSYGLYLWHEPVIALTTPNANLAVQPLRASLQVAGAVVLAALSWRYVEEPIRHHALAQGHVIGPARTETGAHARAHWRRRRVRDPRDLGRDRLTTADTGGGPSSRQPGPRPKSKRDIHRRSIEALRKNHHRRDSASLQTCDDATRQRIRSATHVVLSGGAYRRLDISGPDLE